MIGVFLSVLLALQASGSPALEHVHAGVDAEKSGQLDTAVAEFRKATELDPKLAAAFADLGGVYIEKRDYAAAIPPLKRASSSVPTSKRLTACWDTHCWRKAMPPKRFHTSRRRTPRTRSVSLCSKRENCRRPWPFFKKLWLKVRMIRSCSITMAVPPACSPNRSLTNSKRAFPDSARAHQMMAQDYAVLRRCAERRTGIFRSVAPAPADGGFAPAAGRALRPRAAMGQSRRTIPLRNGNSTRQRRSILSSRGSSAAVG